MARMGAAGDCCRLAASRRIACSYEARDTTTSSRQNRTRPAVGRPDGHHPGELRRGRCCSCPQAIREPIVTEAHADLSGQEQRRPGDQARDGGEDPGQRGNKWWTLVAVCLGTFMLLLDITIVNVALPDIQRALHSSFADLQWVVDAYALTLAAFLLTAGSLADIYGRRLMYLIGLVIFTAASMLCGFAVSTLMLQLSRALQGVGGAIMFAVSLALLADAFRGRDRGTAFGCC